MVGLRKNRDQTVPVPVVVPNSKSGTKMIASNLSSSDYSDQQCQTLEPKSGPCKYIHTDTDTKVTEKGNFACSVCGKLYKHQRSCFLHEKTHLEIFMCKLCGKVFDLKSTITNHVRTCNNFFNRQESDIIITITKRKTANI